MKARRAREDRAYLFVGTRKGAYVYESNYQREIWKRTGPFTAGREVVDIAFDFRDQTTVYALTATEGLWRTRDFGRTWENAGRVDGTSRATALTLGHASQPGTLYAGVEPLGIALSRDAGTSWTPLETLARHAAASTAGPALVQCLAVHAASPDCLYAAVSGVGVLRSEDAGKSWQPASHGLDGRAAATVQRLAANPARPDTVYVASAAGVYRSTDAGRSWTSLATGLGGRASRTLAVSPAKPATVYVVTEATGKPGENLGVQRSRDGGDTWMDANAGLDFGGKPALSGGAIATDDGDIEGVYLGTSAGSLHISRDEGESWDLVATGIPPITGVAPVLILGD